MEFIHRHAGPLLITACVIGVMAAGVIYFTLDPATNFFPRCMFHEVTGLSCPGCGSQRALHALLHGDLPTAWGYNALFILEIPLLLLLAVAWMLRRSHPSLHRILNSRSLILSLLAIIILWTVVRNILNV